MLRIRPPKYYDQYTKDEVKPWTMRIHGRTFEPVATPLPPPLRLAHKKRVFAPERVIEIKDPDMVTLEKVLRANVQARECIPLRPLSLKLL
jgi:hypothetical protein